MRGLLVGRFQPFHRGHLAVLAELKRTHPDELLLLGIGSAQISYTPENPFTASERMEMVLGALDEAKVEGVLPVPLLDIDRHGLWVTYLRSLLPPFEHVYTSNPLTHLLFREAGYEVIDVPWQNREVWEGTRIRRELAAGGPWETAVPPSVARYLRRIDAPARMRTVLEAPRPPSVRPAP